MELTQEQYDALVAQMAEMKTTLQEREAKIERLEVEGILGGDKITDPALVRFLRHEHAQAEVAEGETRPAFGDWFKTYKEANAASPIFAAPAVAAPAKPAAVVTPPVTPPAKVDPAKPVTPPAKVAVAAVVPPVVPPAKPAGTDVTHANRTGGEPASFANMTPQQLTSLTKEQREAFGGWDAILKGIVAPGAENAGGV